MKLSADKKTLQYNEFITIKNILEKIFENLKAEGLITDRAYDTDEIITFCAEKES